MHAKSAVASALLAALPLANAGSVTVNNACGFVTYLWTVTNTPGEMKTLHPGQSITEPYQINPDGGGTSVKIARQPTSYGEVTQFEYTLTSTLWYDMSNINGNPFSQWGMSLTPSNPGCRDVLCPAGVSVCSQVYNAPHDDFATAACTPDTDTTLVLCSGQDNNQTPVVGGGSGAVNVASKHHGKPHHNAPAPAPAPAPEEHHHHHKPAPAPTSAPVVPVPTAAPAPAPLTTFVTHIVTVTAGVKRSAEPSAKAAPRAVPHRHHHHRHAHRMS